jgi:hypothetical protein
MRIVQKIVVRQPKTKEQNGNENIKIKLTT